MRLCGEFLQRGLRMLERFALRAESNIAKTRSAVFALEATTIA